mgnify:CR=1 FL=1
MHAQTELVVRSHLGTARLSVQCGAVQVELVERGVCITGDEIEIVPEKESARLIVREQGCVALLLSGVDIVRLHLPFVLQVVPSEGPEDVLMGAAVQEVPA